MFKALKLFLTGVFFLLFTVSTYSQRPKDKKITKKEKAIVIQKIGQMLEKRYVFADSARIMSKLLRDKLLAGKYSNITTTIPFAKQLTDDLRANFQDEHIAVKFAPRLTKMLRKTQETGEYSQEAIEKELAVEKYENFRFPTIKRYPGNIGYIKVDQFLPPSYARGYEEKMAAIFEFVAETDALIIDLSECPGGYAEGAIYFGSYFFPAKTHFMTSMTRIDGKTNTTKSYSLDKVKGKRYLDKPVYVIVSKRTASAAEAVTHVMKYSKRATVVGTSTYGAGYSFDVFPVDDNFVVDVPNSSGKHPNAEGNWEGVGVTPDIKIDVSEAINKAKLLATEKVYQLEMKKPKKERYQYRIESLEWEKSKYKDLASKKLLNTEEQKKYIGLYGSRVVFQKANQMYCQISSIRRPRKMIYIGKDKFILEGEEKYSRVEFLSNKEGKIHKLKLTSKNRVLISNKK